MFRQIIIGAASALTIAGGSLFVAGPAQAGQFGIYVNPGYLPPPPDGSGCWRWSSRAHRWRWVCQEPQYYQPYYSEPAPFFGFSFGGGDREYFRGRDHDEEGGDYRYEGGDGGDHHDEGNEGDRQNEEN